VDESAMLESMELDIEGMTCERCAERVEEALQGLPGVDAVHAEVGHARVLYYPHMTGRREVERSLSLLGYRAAGAKRKGAVARWLDRLAAANRKNFGEKTLDCCSLNRKHPEA
jgi:copper chaperone CopZ